MYNQNMTKLPPTRRKQAERTKASREKIIQEATHLFSENGFRGTYLSDIAAGVGMTEAGILHHFPSKVHLLISVLEERDRIDQENYGQSLGTGNFDVIEVFKTLAEHNEKVPGLVQLFSTLIGESLPTSHPSHDYFVNRYQSLRKILTEEIKKAQEKGALRSDINPETIAILIFAMMDGLQIQWLLSPDEVHLFENFNHFLDFLSEKK